MRDRQYLETMLLLLPLLGLAGVIELRVWVVRAAAERTRTSAQRVLDGVAAVLYRLLAICVCVDFLAVAVFAILLRHSSGNGDFLDAVVNVVEGAVVGTAVLLAAPILLIAVMPRDLVAKDVSLHEAPPGDSPPR